MLLRRALLAARHNSARPVLFMRWVLEQKKSLRRTNHRSDLKSIIDLTLANAGPHKPAVVLYAHLATGKEICHGGCCFFGVLRARAYGKNKIAEGKFRTRFEDLFGRFHDQSSRIRAHRENSLALRPKQELFSTIFKGQENSVFLGSGTCARQASVDTRLAKPRKRVYKVSVSDKQREESKSFEDGTQRPQADVVSQETGNAIRQYRPAFFESYENETVSFDTLEELKQIPWVANFASRPSADFHQFSFSGDMLMAEYRGGREWWVVGRLKEKVAGLPEWNQGLYEVLDGETPKDILGADVAWSCGDDVGLRDGRTLKRAGSDSSDATL